MKFTFILSSILIVLSSHSMAISQNPEPIVELNGDRFKTKILLGSFAEHAEILRKSFLVSPVSLDVSSDEKTRHTEFVQDFYLAYSVQSGNYRPNFFDPNYTGPWQQYPEGPWAYNGSSQSNQLNCFWRPTSNWWSTYSSPCFEDVDNFLRDFQAQTYWISVIRIPSDAHTSASFYPNSLALRHTFNLQSANIAQGLSYDCTIFDVNNMCVSFAGTSSNGADKLDNTTGALIIAHRPTANIRVGGYVDQNIGTTDSMGLKVKRGSPGYGVFGVWLQRADGLGTQVRVAANSGKVDVETTRQLIGTAEAGFGQSNIKSNGIQLEVSQGYALNNQWTTRPYVGYRQMTNKRGAYTESSTVDFPLAYDGLKQTTESILAGIRFVGKLTPQTSLNLSAGIERDVKSMVDNYQAINADIGDIDAIKMTQNINKTRPVASVGLVHSLDKTQTVGLFVTHRKEALQSSSTTSGMLQYSVGF